MKKRIFLIVILASMMFIFSPNLEAHSNLIQQEPTEEAVQDSVSIDDADPIFYDVDEETEDMQEPSGEKNPLTWALYLGGAAIIIIIVAVILRRSRKEDSGE